MNLLTSIIARADLTQDSVYKELVSVADSFELPSDRYADKMLSFVQNIGDLCTRFTKADFGKVKRPLYA